MLSPVGLPLLFAIAACVNALDLSSSEQTSTVPLLDYNFGDVQVHTSSAPQTFTIRPASGAQVDKVNSITASCPDFMVTAPGLPADVTNVCTGGSGCPTYTATTYSFTATFTPTVAAQVSCVVTVTIDTVPTTFTLTGRGKEPTIRASVSPASALDIGEVRVGDTSSEASVLVTNFGSGPQPMTVSSVAFDAAGAAAGLAIASGTPSSHVVAAAGGTDAYGITCTPTASGPISGTLTIATDDPAAPTTAITVTCTGITSNLVFGPKSPALLGGTQAQGATRVGEPIDLTITLSNSGVAAMTIHSVAITGTQLTLGTVPAAESSLASGGTTNVGVHFAASAPVAQGTLGTVTVNYDNGLVRSINVLGAALATTMAISPDGAVDLGPVCVGNTASKSFFVLKNSPGTFLVTAINQPAAPFQLAGTLPTAGGPIAVDTNALTFTASVTPTAALTLHSSFAVTTDIPGATPHEISLAAIGLPAGISATPMMMDLGTISVGATSIGQTLTVTNCGTAPLNLLETQLLGTNKADFAIVSAPTSATIATGGSASYVIVTKPTTTGALTATLQIRHDQGMLTIPLAGTGTGMVVDNRVPETSTYYSCTVGRGGPLSASMVVLALALVLRRRTRGPA
jgi:hypothetical protein